MKTLTCWADDEAATDRLGRTLAELLPVGSTVALWGTLGAGKTRLVQAIAAGCGVDPEQVVSPTFVLCHQYEGTRTIYHLDAYRLRGEDDLWDIGLEQYLSAPAITLIEWADRVPGCLPEEHLRVEIEVRGRQSRSFQLTGVGRRYESVLDELSQRLAPA